MLGNASEQLRRAELVPPVAGCCGRDLHAVRLWDSAHIVLPDTCITSMGKELFVDNVRRFLIIMMNNKND